jgi:catechol 2,3-dioxygenase-like lactoylglutathione lyase family enzyme
MLKRIDRLILRVPQVESAVKYYRDVLGLEVTRHETKVASMRLGDGETELVLHSDEDLPAEAIYFLVDDVREIYQRRDELKLKFNSPPAQAAHGYRATVHDPFGNVLLLIDRTTATNRSNAIEDAKSPGALFAGVATKVSPKNEVLAKLYAQMDRTADDLPYTPQFETIYTSYIAALPEPKPTREETWRHLLNLRKAGKLAKLGEAKSTPPEVDDESRQRLREMLGADIGKRDRLPYTKRFDDVVNQFNETLPRRLSPHLVWRLVATLAK